MFWQHTIEGEKVEFDNIPFIVSQIQKMHCQFGIHYYKEKRSEKSNRTCLQGTCKIGCSAHVAVHSIVLYPDFGIANKEASTRELKK